MDSIVETVRSVLIRILLKDREYLSFRGLIKARELPPGCDLGAFLAWWPRLSERERERYTAYEHTNILTTSGRNQLLTYVGSSTATTLGFGQFFAVGNIGLNAVSPGDTIVAGEFYRAVPNTATITGTQIDISTYFGPSQGNGLISNAGLFGINATSTAGSGTLTTHALYNYTKPNGTGVTFDYLINLQ